MRVSATVRWTALALLGILIAAAVSVAASRLASQQIGLASEPISAGDALAPSRQEHRPAAALKRGPSKPAKPKQPPPIPSTTTPSPEPEPSTSPAEVEPSPGGADGERSDGGADD